MTIARVPYTRQGSRVTVPVILDACPDGAASNRQISELIFDAGGFILQNPGVPEDVVGEIWAQLLRQGF